MTFNDSAGGIKNSAGYLEYHGLNKFSTNTKEDQYFERVRGIRLDYIDGPSPETLFKLSSKPDISTSFKEPPKPTPIGWTLPVVREAFIKARQSGYRTRTDQYGNLTGIKDFIGSSNNDPGKVLFRSSTMPLSEPGIEPEQKQNEPTTKARINPNIVNEESARYRWGDKLIPPEFGASLPGSIQKLQQGSQSGQIIWNQKHKGDFNTGRYSGYQSAKYAQNGMVSYGSEV